MNAADLERPRTLVQEAADVAIDDVVASRLSLTASTLAEICDVDSPVLRSDLLQDAMHHLTQAIGDGGQDVRVPARNAQQLLIAAINEDWPSPRRDDRDVRADGGTKYGDKIPDDHWDADGFRRTLVGLKLLAVDVQRLRVVVSEGPSLG